MPNVNVAPKKHIKIAACKKIYLNNNNHNNNNNSNSNNNKRNQLFLSDFI